MSQFRVAQRATQPSERLKKPRLKEKCHQQLSKHTISFGSAMGVGKYTGEADIGTRSKKYWQRQERR